MGGKSRPYLSRSLSMETEGAQGRDLAPFFGNFSQSEKSSEIKPPLTGAKNVSLL